MQENMYQAEHVKHLRSRDTVNKPGKSKEFGLHVINKHPNHTELFCCRQGLGCVKAGTWRQNLCLKSHPKVRTSRESNPQTSSYGQQ